MLCPARTPTNIRLYSDEDIRRIQWIRHLTRDRGVNLAGIKILFELEERLGKRILEALYDEGMRNRRAADASAAAEPETAPREQHLMESTTSRRAIRQPSFTTTSTGDT